MSDLKSHIIEKGNEIAGNLPVQVGIPVYTVGTGSLYTFGMIQDLLGIVSVCIGIIAGLLLIIINYRKGRGVKLDNDSKELINRKINLEIKALEDKVNGNSNK